MNLTEEDIKDLVSILNEQKQMCIKFDYQDEKTAQFVYDVDCMARAMLEIIEKPVHKIERMI